MRTKKRETRRSCRRHTPSRVRRAWPRRRRASERFLPASVGLAVRVVANACLAASRVVSRQLVSRAIIAFLTLRILPRVPSLTLCPVAPRGRVSRAAPISISPTGGPIARDLVAVHRSVENESASCRALPAASAARIYAPCPVTDTFYVFSTLRSSADGFPLSPSPTCSRRRAGCKAPDRARDREITPESLHHIGSTDRVCVLTRLLAREQ